MGNTSGRDFDRIMASPRTGENCKFLIEYIHEELLTIPEPEWVRFCTRPTTDELWNSTAALLCNSAREVFCKQSEQEAIKSILEKQLPG